MRTGLPAVHLQRHHRGYATTNSQGAGARPQRPMPLWLWQEVQALPWSTEIVALTCCTQNCLRPPPPVVPTQASTAQSLLCNTVPRPKFLEHWTAFDKSQFIDHTGSCQTKFRQTLPQAFQRRFRREPLAGRPRTRKKGLDLPQLLAQPNSVDIGRLAVWFEKLNIRPHRGQPSGHRYPRHSLAAGSNDRYPENKRPRNGRLRALQMKFPVIAQKFPVLQNIFPVNLRQEFRKKSLQHSGFVQRNWLLRPQNRKIPCYFPC